MSNLQQNTFIEVNGRRIEVEPGADFATKVMETANNAGLNKFHVYLGDEEIGQDNAPQTFEEGMQVYIRRYDQAG